MKSVVVTRATQQVNKKDDKQQQQQHYTTSNRANNSEWAGLMVVCSLKYISSKSKIRVLSHITHQLIV
jgi:hypothetical protein